MTHPVLRFDVSGAVTDEVRRQLATVPAGVVVVRTENGATVVEVDLDRVPDAGVPVRGLRLRVAGVSLGERCHLVVGVDEP